MLVLGELTYLFNARHFVASSLGRDSLTDNKVALWVSALLLLMLVAFTHLPPMQALFRTVGLDTAAWAVVVALALVKFGCIEAEKALLRRMGVQRI